MEQIKHDLAFQMATELVRIIENCIRPEEHRDAHEEFYRVCKKGLEDLIVRQDRMARRMRPGRK